MLKKNIFKKTILVVFTVLFTTLFLTGCQSLTKKKGATAEGAPEIEEISGTFAQGSEEGITYSDPEKCQVAQNTPGVEQHIFFEFDRSDVSSQFVSAIKTQASYLNSHPHARVKIEGHTDDRGSREYNVALGWERAKAVVQLLREYGVRQNQITATSFGAERPVAFGQSETAWRCNRRVDLLFQ